MGETAIPESALIGRREQLVSLISTTLQDATTFRPVIDFCDRMKLPMGDAQGITNSKRLYVRERVKTLEDHQLIELGIRVTQEFSGRAYDLSEFFHLLREAPDERQITRLTRSKILDELDWGLELFPDKKRPEELSKVWPGKTLPNDADWYDNTYLNSRYLEQCCMLECSRYNFNALLEAMVHPEHREGKEQLQLVETLNRHLRPDNYELQHVSNLSGRPVYKVRPARGGVGGSPKNIIFAADGPKPEIVFRDAINNDIEIVKNAEFCLVYNWPLDEDGLSWRKLASWWQEQQNEPDESSARKSLGTRLFKSLDNPAEQKVFSVYYKHFASLKPDLPALIPQVYLHYDPYTARQLQGAKNLERQRMDFLMLFGRGIRVVLEVDGKQHYSTPDGAASPKLYADMVAADRQLKLAGYELYRFGGLEVTSNQPEAMLKDFFEKLLAKHKA